MSVDLVAVGDRVQRGLDSSRRNAQSHSSMMQEVGSSGSSSEDDTPIRRPVRGGGRGRGRGGALPSPVITSLSATGGIGFGSTPTSRPGSAASGGFGFGAGTASGAPGAAAASGAGGLSAARSTAGLSMTPIALSSARSQSSAKMGDEEDVGPKFGFAKSAAVEAPRPSSASSGAGAGAGGLTVLTGGSGGGSLLSSLGNSFRSFASTGGGTPKGAADPEDGVAAAATPVLAINASTLRPYVMRPCDYGAPMLQCSVTRNKSGLNLLHPVWSMHVEEGNRFLMSGKKRMGKKTSNYLVCMDLKASDRVSPLLLGKLRSNWSGSGYHIYDNGVNPDKEVLDTSKRKDFGFVGFGYDEAGPGTMQVAVPRVSERGVPVVFRPTSEREGTVEACAGSVDTARLMLLSNKKPTWDEKVGGHVLNFGGRVTKSSVKNFQLVCRDTGEEVVLQFGRVGKNTFHLDFRFPLSPFQAFCIVLSALDGKVADSKSFQVLKSVATAVAGYAPAEKDDSD